jgi:hypothetical protein
MFCVPFQGSLQGPPAAPMEPKAKHSRRPSRRATSRCVHACGQCMLQTSKLKTGHEPAKYDWMGNFRVSTVTPMEQQRHHENLSQCRMNVLIQTEEGQFSLYLFLQLVSRMEHRGVWLVRYWLHLSQITLEDNLADFETFKLL